MKAQIDHASVDLWIILIAIICSSLQSWACNLYWGAKCHSHTSINHLSTRKREKQEVEEGRQLEGETRERSRETCVLNPMNQSDFSPL